MYNVHMKRYTVAQARQRFAELLNAAETGQPVIIERRGTRFVLQTDRARPRRPAGRRPVIEIVDPAVGAGEWTWDWTREGLRFAGRAKRR
jgi:prevent-host-death family protein